MLLFAIVFGCLFVASPLTAASGVDRERAIEEGLYELPPRGANWCGTSIMTERWMAEQKLKNGDAALELPYCQVNGQCDTKSQRDQWYPGSYPEIYFVRTVFHIFTYDDGLGATATEAQVLATLDRMQDDFLPSGFQFDLVSILTHADGTFRDLDFDGNEDATMKLLYSVSAGTTLNIYIVNIQSTQGNILGYSYLPHQFPLHYRSGCVLDMTVMGYSYATATHEAGHFFGLQHTFRGVDEVTACSGCYEEPEGGHTDNDAVGDYCSDTPPTPTNFLCDPPGGTDVCSGMPWGVTQVENYMGYSHDACQEFFTQQQHARMRCWFNDELYPLNNPDVDSDGIPNGIDNCPTVANTNQDDTEDPEGDLVGDACDNCPDDANRDQADYDADDIGDVCDDCTDTDEDGYGDPGFAANTCPDDNCPENYNPSQEDTDTDLLGDSCDNCPNHYNPGQEDEWDDGIGDLCDGFVHIYLDDMPDTAYLGEPFSYFFQAVGATPPYTWTKQGGDLPFGLSLNGATGELSGTPNWNGTYYFTMKCEDSGDPVQSDTVYNVTLWVSDPPEPEYVCGDANDDETANISDAVYIITWIFSGGPGPVPLEAGDANCDGTANISDAVYLITYIFGGGPPPCDTNDDGTPDC